MLVRTQTFVFGFLGAGALAENSTTWIYPPDPNGAGSGNFSGLSINYRDTMNIQWTSTYPSSESDPRHMALWCGKTNIQPWNTQVPQNGTQSLSFTNLDFKNWPLPLNCYISLGGAINGSGSAYFVLNNQDPNLPPKTWGAVTTSTAAPTSSSSFTDPATTTPIFTITTPTPAASTVTIAAIATPTAPSNTATAPQGSTPNVSKGAIAGATVGGFVTVALCLIAFLVQRRHRARRVEEGQSKAYESRENVPNDAPPYWKPEMPTDNQPQLLHEMPLEQNPGYSLAPYEMHNVETQEMPATPGLRLAGTHEMPGTPALR